MTEHTPLPWRAVNRGLSDDWDIVGANDEDMSGILRGMLFREEDVKLILQAVNSHEELLGAAKKALKAYSKEERLLYSSVFDPLEDAVKKAERGTPSS